MRLLKLTLRQHFSASLTLEVSFWYDVVYLMGCITWWTRRYNADMLLFVEVKVP